MSAPRKNFSNQRRNRPYQGNRQQSNNRNVLIESGARGFFVTVEGNMQEKPAVREIYNLFDSLPEENGSTSNECKVESPVDAADELAAACAEINTKTPGPQNNTNPQRRLRQVPTNVRNCLFFQTELPATEVYAAAEKIVDKCQANNFCRFLARLIPVESVTGTDSGQMMKALERLVHYHFVETWKGDNAPTYALEFKTRNNTSFTQKDILEVLDDLIKCLSPLSRVNLSKPDLTILVNVLNRNVLFSCVRNYQSKRKFSVRPPQEKPPASGDQKPSDETTS